jgi:lipopolysaccharide/colanic/teichoic acid biosynthesis glycosyltransferase
VSRGARLLLDAGIAACVVALGRAHAAVHGYAWSGSPRVAWSVGYVALLAVAAYGFGLPERPERHRGAALAAVGATTAAAVGVSVVQLFAGDALLPRFVVLGSAGVLVPWFVLCAAVARDTRSRAGERDRVLVVAEPDEAERLTGELAREPERPATVVASMAPREASSVSVPPSRPLVDAARGVRATVVVLGRAAQNDDDVVLQASLLHEEGVRIRTLSLFYEQWLGKLPIGELERVSLLFDIGELHEAGYARVKRLVDVVLASCGMVVLALVTPIVLAGNLVANRGPLWFRQPRTGRGGRSFEMLKFRTMRACSTAEANDWTAVDDVRVTSFGRFLRRLHLDELPQVLNVLRGELSVVGPRPEQPRVVAELSGKLPFYAVRHLVRPGLTGWAQVKYQYAGSDAETLEKLQYEFFYLRRQSLALDLRIVGRTLRSIVAREGR